MEKLHTSDLTHTNIKTKLEPDIMIQNRTTFNSKEHDRLHSDIHSLQRGKLGLLIMESFSETITRKYKLLIWAQIPLYNKIIFLKEKDNKMQKYIKSASKIIMTV